MMHAIKNTGEAGYAFSAGVRSPGGKPTNHEPEACSYESLGQVER